MLDLKARALIAACPSLCVPWYLMAGYCYEHLDRSILSDGMWDEVCSTLDRDWDKIDHFHKNLVDRLSLCTGTFSYLPAHRLPLRVIGAAEYLLRSGSNP